MGGGLGVDILGEVGLAGLVRGRGILEIPGCVGRVWYRRVMAWLEGGPTAEVSVVLEG